MNKSALFAASATAALYLTSAAMAGDAVNASNDNITIEQVSQYLHYSSGNDRMRVEIAPNYSEELGFSLKGAVGSYLTDEIALGLIVEYGEHKREYLANAGIQFTDALSFVGTVGMLEEHNEYVAGEGREVVQQMEYGASLKGAYEVGILSGFELNGYLADADADSDSVETGKLYGVQLLADLDLTDTTHVKLGGGYEWLEWDDTNEDDSSWTASAAAAQHLGDALSLTGHAKLGASEYVYGGGLAYDLSNGGLNSNSLALNYSYIDGRNGIEDDQRVELSWTVGFGAGPTTSVAAADLTDKTGTIRAAADVAMVSPANNLLTDVIKRPGYLPETVIARTRAILEPPPPVGPTCEDFGTLALGAPSYDIVAGTGDFSSYMIVTFYFVTSSPELSASIDQMFELEVTNQGGTPIYIYKQAFYNSTSQNFPINGFFLNTQAGFTGTVEVTLRPLGSSTLASCTPKMFSVPVTYNGPA